MKISNLYRQVNDYLSGFRSRRTVIRRIEKISSVGVLLSSLENLQLTQHRATGGLAHWETMRVQSEVDGVHAPSGTIMKLRDKLYKLPLFDEASHALAAGLAIHQILGLGKPKCRGVIGLTQATLQWVLAPKNSVGGDGSDQVRFLVNALTGMYGVTSSRSVQNAVLWTISIQAALSYAVSGLTKLAGVEWRTNRALIGVVRTRAYGHKRLWEFLKRYPHVSKTLEWLTIGIEITYPLVFFRNPKITGFYVVSVSTMHIVIGYVMGLNRFIPAFLSMQPAIIYCTQRQSAKNSIIPHLYIMGILLVVAAGLVSRVRDSLILNNPIYAPTEQICETRSGAFLSYEVFYAKNNSRSAPTVYFESGLSAVKDHWLYIVDQLSDYANCVIYDRPGIGHSYNAKSVPIWQDYERDIADLVANTRLDGECFLCGHSIGGYLVSHRFPEVLRGVVRGLILLDPASTSAFLENHYDAEMQEGGFSSSLRSMEFNTRAGLGWMLDRSLWNSIVNDEARTKRLGAIYRQPGVWQVARGEWATYCDEVWCHAYSPENSVPVLVLVAGQTAQRNSSYMRDYSDLVDHSLKYSKLSTIDGATHVSLLNDHVHSLRAVENMKDFMQLVSTNDNGDEVEDGL